MSKILQELKSLKAKQKRLSDNFQKETTSILQRIEQLEELNQGERDQEGDAVQIAILKAAQRRGYSKRN